MTVTEYFTTHETWEKLGLKYPEYYSGDLVRDRYGRTYRVRSQTGCMVFMENETDWWHPANLTRI